MLKPNPSLSLIRKFAAVPPSAQFTTAITVGELMYGAYKVKREELATRIHTIILTGLEVLPFDQRAAEAYAQLRVQLESKGKPLAEPDLRISAIAITHQLTVVTNNLKHFKRVPNLSVESWL